MQVRRRRETRERTSAALAGSCITLVADRAYPKGQEVVASYGFKSSGELLVSYGFIPPPGTNPHDTFMLTLRVRPPPNRMPACVALAVLARGFSAACMRR
jgi:hypothetical protein